MVFLNRNFNGISKSEFQYIFKLQFQIYFKSQFRKHFKLLIDSFGKRSRLDLLAQSKRLSFFGLNPSLYSDNNREKVNSDGYCSLF